MKDLKRQLEQLGERGEARGASRVLAGARRDSSGRGVLGRPTRLVTAVAVAASVTLVAGVAAAVIGPNDDRPRQETATAPTTEPTTTTAPDAITTTVAPETTLPTVQLPAKLIAASRLAPFSNCGQYLSYVKRKAATVMTPYGLPIMARFVGAGPVNTVPPPTVVGPDGQPQPVLAQRVLPTTDFTDYYSRTNVQEPGIDEPDLIKTDGQTLFSITGQVLQVVRVTGAPKKLASLPIPGGVEMLLIGDRVVVFGSNPDGITAMVAVVDVSRPAAPRLLSRMEIDGSYLSARLVNGVPRVIVRSVSQPHWVQPNGESENGAALDQNRRIAARSSARDWLPELRMTEGPRKGRQVQLTDCTTAYRPPNFSGFATLNLITLNMADPSQSYSTSVVADGDIVYGSSTRMYVASTSWGPIDSMTVQPVAETLVHDFDISAPDRAAYRASGKVRGVALNQFSFSEDEGYLRVATTETNATGLRESYVSVLADKGQALVQVGQVGGLGKGENIQAVRFIGKTAYVVTFRQTDPLYVVDVSVPTKPVVRGELKMLGYSAYLHPIGDGLLLGVGVDATEDGQREGLAVNLFDVSKPAAPKVLRHRSLGSGYSSASEFDHHAFLWWAPTRLMAIPFVGFDEQGGRDAGLIGLRVDRGRIDEVGRTRHPTRNVHEFQQRPDVLRSVVVGDSLYTLSEWGLRQSALSNLADRAYVEY